MLYVMAKEIERKFLVKDDSYKCLAYAHSDIIQGYLSTDPDRNVRIRIADNCGYITIKTRNDGIVRDEWEFKIPFADAKEILNVAATKIIDKTRYFIDAGNGLKWEVDDFHGSLSGLTIAEIELPSSETTFEKPSFIGEDISGDPRFFNSNLATQV